MARVIIPTKVVIAGDVETGRKDYGFAQLQMSILENLMRVRGLTQYGLTRKGPNGSVVEVWAGFGLRQITITAKPVGPVVEKKTTICWCNGCVALGRVIAVHDIVFVNDGTGIRCFDKVDSYPELDLYYCAGVVYDVEVCNEHAYVEFLNIVAMDNTPYCVDDQVIIAPVPSSSDAESLIDTICYSTCGAGCFAAIGSPIINVSIVQVDASLLPRWISKKVIRGHSDTGRTTLS